MMKKLISVAAVFVMLIVGCSNQENSITSPISLDADQFSKSSTPTDLPTKYATTIKVITGSEGGKLSLNQKVLSSYGRVVEIFAEFELPANAFVGKETIKMTVDADNGCITFSPHMNFNTPCYLTYGLLNMNLSKIGFSSDDRRADFVYFNDRGSIEPIQNMEVRLDYRKGYILVNKAQLKHFSRYGFVRKNAGDDD